MKKYPQIEAGQKVDLEWRKEDYKIACCDCNLVHRFRFAVVGDKLRIRAWRDNRSTAALRRWRGKGDAEHRKPAEVFHPGVYLHDELKARGWSQVEFAWIIDRPIQVVNKIINGKSGISAKTAKELSAALGTSAQIWMNLDTAYKLWKTPPAG